MATYDKELLGLATAEKAAKEADDQEELDFLRIKEEALEDGLRATANNLTNISKVLDGEQARLQQVNQQIQHCENILRAHKICVHERDHGDHDWEILEMFKEIHLAYQWSKRRCRDCGTEQRLGYE